MSFSYVVCYVIIHPLFNATGEPSISPQYVTVNHYIKFKKRTAYAIHKTVLS